MRLLKYFISLFSAVFMTILLFSFLLSVGKKEISHEKILKYGAMKLSSYKEESMDKEEETELQKTPDVKSMQDFSMEEIAMENVEMDISAADISIDFSTAVVGTVPVGAMPALAAPAQKAGISGGAFTLGEVDEHPRALYAPPPLYPPGERGKKKIYVRITLFEDGTVHKAEPLTPDEENAAFYKSALKAVKKWRFIPCKKGGKAVRCIADQPFSFKQKN